MSDNAAIFWENVKKEIKMQNTTHEWIAKKAGISFNTFQGWISKAIYPRVNEAVRIAQALNTSVEYLVRGTVKDNTKAIDIICKQLLEIHNRLNLIEENVKRIN
jgi:transcriptional regulator with XRE-family HTH domain